MAKIEYMACKEKVEAMLAQDFNPKLIHFYADTPQHRKEASPRKGCAFPC
jgi:hypothetical protein